MRITVTGIKQALRAVEHFADTDAKMREVADRLCAIGYPIINSIHGGRSSVYVDDTQPNGMSIIAEGKEVLFIEFGTGDSAGIHAAAYDAVPNVVYPSSFSASAEGAHQYEMLGFWFWHGQVFRETAPHPAFYDAYRAMTQAIPQIVDEVFGK